MIGYGHQSINEDDIAAVVSVLRSDRLTQGPAVERFEDALCEYTGAAHAVALSSGTAALHLAYLAHGLGPGDTFWCPAITFRATSAAARYCGATVKYVDVDPATGLLCSSVSAETARAVHAVLGASALYSTGLRVVVDMAGAECPILGSAPTVRDACHSLGGQWLNGHITACLSFHPVKSITTGEGGAVLTDDPLIADTCRRLRTHDGDPGYNYRMSDIAAALGRSQLARIDGFIARRRELAARYNDALADVDVGLPAQSLTHGAWHLYQIAVEDRDAVAWRMTRAGIGVQIHYPTLAPLPGALYFAAHTLSLPLYPDLTETQQDTVIEALKGAIP